jgi:hypothetical protein
VASIVPAPAWCSTALRELFYGVPRNGYVAASGEWAAYVNFGGNLPAVVAVVAPGGVRLPLSLLPQTMPRLTEGMSARIGNGVLDIGTDRWHPARWWDPRPRLDTRALRTSGRRLFDVVAERDPSAFGVPVRAAVAAAQGLADRSAQAAISLLGRGPGFTPAGDDVVAGALAALSLSNTLDPVTRNAVLDAAADRTTALSAALLHCAAAGETVPAAGRLLAATVASTDADLATRAAELYAVGATSGSALALGMAAALAALRPANRGPLEMESR